MMLLSNEEGVVVEIEREKITACMTCLICRNLVDDATTISECLHSFCRKCIYDKIKEEEADACPVCCIDLGAAALEKLRADDNLQELRVKIFPSVRKDPLPIKALFPVSGGPAVGTTVRRKERTLSSLGINTTPTLSAKPQVVEKRSKSSTRKTLMLLEPAVAVEELAGDACVDVSKNLTKETHTAKHTKENSHSPDSDKYHMPQRDTEAGPESAKDKNMWRSLHELVEAATNCKLSKSLPEGDGKHRNKSKANCEESNSTTPRSNLVGRCILALRTTTAVISDGQNIPKPKQSVHNANYARCDGKYCPIWFSLVAANDQNVAALLPQISSRYLRVKDCSLPVSYIKRYIVQKLDLQSEAEVEIMLRGQPVVSTMLLLNLVERWVETAPSTSAEILTTVGSSGKDFMMVLSYARKARTQ